MHIKAHILIFFGAYVCAYFYDFMHIKSQALVITNGNPIYIKEIYLIIVSHNIYGSRVCMGSGDH